MTAPFPSPKTSRPCAFCVIYAEIKAAVVALRFPSFWTALRLAVLAFTRIWPSVSGQQEISSGVRGLSPQAFSHIGGLVYCLVPEAPLLRGMPREQKVFLVMPGACVLRICARTDPPPPKKMALRHTCTFGGACNKYHCSSCSKHLAYLRVR